ncbi:MAG: hypothetical protein UH854_06190 [Clostridia bacterium]|nr:hypothetical protein [Clostridia bacterium]
MNYDDFLNWLFDEKKLSQRAAKDVVSRCKRICKMLNINEFGVSTLEKLNSNKEFSEKSMFIKSQLRRACNLWFEFGGEHEKI